MRELLQKYPENNSHFFSFIDTGVQIYVPISNEKRGIKYAILLQKTVFPRFFH